MMVEDSRAIIIVGGCGIGKTTAIAASNVTDTAVTVFDHPSSTLTISSNYSEDYTDYYSKIEIQYNNDNFYKKLVSDIEIKAIRSGWANPQKIGTPKPKINNVIMKPRNRLHKNKLRFNEICKN